MNGTPGHAVNGTPGHAVNATPGHTVNASPGHAVNECHICSLERDAPKFFFKDETSVKLIIIIMKQ